ncbi:MAG: zf-HC2 domain-containing protein [Planctomycetes bacterium]|nr:zf-HC2 domain-containing protein [Planctomycetota bacterium]
MNQQDHICAEIENHLALYVGGDLEDAAATEVALHLSQCTPCTERERAARRSRELLVSALELSQRKGPELWPGVRASLVREGVLASEPQSLSRSSRLLRTPFLAYAAAAAALLLTFWLGREAFDKPAPDRTTPDGSAPIVAENLPAPEVRSPVVPVLEKPADRDGGLRLVGREEALLREPAVIYGDLPWGEGLMGPRDPNATTPVGLGGPTRR